MTKSLPPAGSGESETVTADEAALSSWRRSRGSTRETFLRVDVRGMADSFRGLTRAAPVYGAPARRFHRLRLSISEPQWNQRTDHDLGRGRESVTMFDMRRGILSLAALIWLGLLAAPSSACAQ